ncbi:MAG: tetratricopeptide repeat protein [Sphingobium sp.]
MMGWAIVAALFVLTGAGLLVAGRLPTGLRELVGAALLFGVAGYAWQGNPSMPGSPRDPREAAPHFDEDLAKLRNAFGGGYGKAAGWLTMSDGFARQGRSKDAVNVLVSAVRAEPRDPNLWVGLGNALVAHGEGVVSPAAEYSFRQAMRIAPDASSAPYFYGLALAQSGQYASARKVWGALLARVPEKAPLHADLIRDIDQLDRILAGQAETGGE